jgi:serine/threonine-protein kinase ULK/ATG1
MLKTSNNFYFIYEYCNGGTLENLLSKQIKLSEQNALLIFKQLIEAFQILNKYNIMHRDMKPDNIFFHNGLIKLGDFGFCKNLNSADEMTKTMLGSPIYMAPEVLKGEIYSNKADIWSLGVVLFEMIYGMCPFQSNSIANLIEVLNSKELQFPGPISPFLKNVITRMLTKDPIRRISWMELFQIKINNQGEIENEKIIPKINSLNEAKNSEEGQTQLLHSNKLIGKMDNSEEPIRDFKKNRNMSTNSSHNNSPPVNININPNMGYVSSQQILNSPTLPQMNSPPSNILSPNSKPVYLEQPQPKPTSSYGKDGRVGDEHKLVLEGVRLAM